MLHSDYLTVVNTDSGAEGLAVSLEDSPYWHEQINGLQRLKVWTEVPSSGSAKVFGWDWWLLKDVTVALPDAAAANTLAAIA